MVDQARAPWLVWTGGQEAFCCRCRARITLPSGCRISSLLAFLDAEERAHRGCPPVRVAVFPDWPFVEWDETDAGWAVPLGIARFVDKEWPIGKRQT